MRLLFDLGHPAHVHLFRNLIKKLTSEGGEVLAATPGAAAPGTCAPQCSDQGAQKVEKICSR
ncbi:MAG TPA: hypothetical protein HA348_06740 [Thermoplasmata archaeon]|nr:hypothetical protein [Thermoplasmata archaeon]